MRQYLSHNKWSLHFWKERSHMITEMFCLIYLESWRDMWCTTICVSVSVLEVIEKHFLTHISSGKLSMIIWFHPFSEKEYPFLECEIESCVYRSLSWTIIFWKLLAVSRSYSNSLLELSLAFCWFSSIIRYTCTLLKLGTSATTELHALSFICVFPSFITFSRLCFIVCSIIPIVTIFSYLLSIFSFILIFKNCQNEWCRH